MATPTRFRLLISLLILCGFWSAGYTQASISVTGSWSLTIDATGLQSGAGSDLEDMYSTTVCYTVTDTG